MVRSVLLMGIALTLAACTQTKAAPELLFDSGKMKDEEWQRAEKECAFEAAKVAAAINVSMMAGEQTRKIYIFCLEAKGLKFLGHQKSDK